MVAVGALRITNGVYIVHTSGGKIFGTFQKIFCFVSCLLNYWTLRSHSQCRARYKGFRKINALNTRISLSLELMDKWSPCSVSYTSTSYHIHEKRVARVCVWPLYHVAFYPKLAVSFLMRLLSLSFFIFIKNARKARNKRNKRRPELAFKD